MPFPSPPSKPHSQTSLWMETLPNPKLLIPMRQEHPHRALVTLHVGRDVAHSSANPGQVPWDPPEHRTVGGLSVAATRPSLPVLAIGPGGCQESLLGCDEMWSFPGSQPEPRAADPTPLCFHLQRGPMHHPQPSWSGHHSGVWGKGHPLTYSSFCYLQN